MLESVILAKTGLIQLIQSYLLNAWYFLLVIIGFGVVVFVHELGHFVMARWVGIKVDVFSLGFGPRLFGIKRGGTDYCVRAVPIGGYVKMMGQEDTAIDQTEVLATKADPRSFLAKTVGQRMLVVSGGVVMNVIFAAIAFILVFRHGLEMPAPIAGFVQPGSPAERAGIEPGDRFIRINGRRVLHFPDVQLATILNGPDEPLELDLKRGDKIIHKTVTPEMEEGPVGRGQRFQMGIAGAGSLKVDSPGTSLSGPNELKKGDMIVKVNGVKPNIFWDVEKTLMDAKGKPVELTVERESDGSTEELTVRKRAFLILDNRLEDEKFIPGSILGLLPRCRILPSALEDSENDDPDLAKANDVIVRVGRITNPTWLEIKKYLEPFRGNEAPIEVLRDGERQQVKLPVPRKENHFKLFVLLKLTTDDRHLVIAGTLNDTPAARAKIPRGAAIVGCDDVVTNDWGDLFEYFKARGGKQVTLHYQLGDEKSTTTLMVPENADWWKHKGQERITYATDMIPEPYMITIRGKYPHQAIDLGIRQTWYIIKTVYVTLQRVAIDRTVQAKEIMGPIYIIDKGRQVAQEGFYRLLYLFALISANLAVINFLPIPALDGGLAVMLVLEKIRRKTLSVRSMAIWQTVGLSMIVALILFVTYNDIMRIVKG